MVESQHQEIWEKTLQYEESKREDAMDCFHSIIVLVEKYFATNDNGFVVWLNVCFEQLKKKFNYESLLKKTIVVHDYVTVNKYMNIDAYISINKLIETICEL